ncbi:CopG family ribbon-helix-helix protein [Massilia alkalitolerans]|uniref:CopG family ribbon-helix-helix protein n=1 Tax=Massilia alkalitolerans TaxID=286638 RepID=UPI001AE1602E|nr:hypothetical protein [Massilia alkalitolerans]
MNFARKGVTLVTPERCELTMTTTSLKLPDELKQRAVSAAQELGLSPHAFMVEAIRQAAHSVEQRSSFVAQALEAKAEMLHEGLGHDADDVRAYLRQRLKDGQTGRPIKKPWRE